jgi:hypothetical protein
MKPSKPTDEFLTPPHIAELAGKILGGRPDFDPWGHPQQVVRVAAMHTKENHMEPWPIVDRYWANPPFSCANEAIPRFAKHLTAHPEAIGLMLCLASTGTKYWRDSIWSAQFGARRIAWIGRTSFLEPTSGGPQKTPHGISRDLALVLWTRDREAEARFNRLVNGQGWACSAGGRP